MSKTLGYVVITFLLLSLNSIAAEVGDADIFSSKDGLTQGWCLRSWNTVNAIDSEITPQGGGKSIKLDYDVNAKRGWGGLTIRLKTPNDITGFIPVNPDEISKYSLKFKINGGRDAMGRFLGGQSLQANVIFRFIPGTKAGKTKYVAISPYLTGNGIDDNPKTWQEVIIPLNRFIKKSFAAGIEGITNVSFQFRGIPASGIYLSDISIAKSDGTQKADATPEASEKITGEPAGGTDAEFAAFDELDESLKVKRGYDFKVEGPNIITDGKPTFLIGTQLCGLPLASLERTPTPGYAEKYKWIYERIPDFESAQRLGFDTMGIFSCNNWITLIDPDIRPHQSPEGEARMEEFVRDIGMPLYVDFTMFPWSGGRLVKSDKIPERAKSNPKIRQHWVVYDPDNEDGLNMYKAYWKFGTEKILAAGAKPLFYELFNEPSYFCQCKDNRAKFVVWLKKEHGDIATLNRKWRTKYASFEDVANFKERGENEGLFVDYGRFLEDRFAEINAEGARYIKSIDTRKTTRITCQPLGFSAIDAHTTSFNYYKMAPHFDVIETPTGSGGLSGADMAGAKKPAQSAIDTAIANLPAVKSALTMNIVRSVAKDKIIVNGESGMPPYTRKDMKNRFWIELLRGINSTYLFVWTRRAWDWKPNTAESGKTLAKRFPYMMLNPYSRPTSSLAGIMDFRKEMIKVKDIVADRRRGIKPEIAVLHSYASRRYNFITKERTMANESMSYYGSMLFSNYLVDSILEEQVLGEDEQNNYRFLVAAGVDFAKPQTREKLKNFAHDGGVVILGMDTLSRDIYGNRLEKDNWTGVEISPCDSTPLEVSLKIPQADALPGKIRGLACRTVRTIDAQIIGEANGKPVITRKQLGKGAVYYIGGFFRDYYLTAILTSILEKENAKKTFSLRNEKGELVTNIESHVINRTDAKAIILWNWDKHTKLGFLRPEGGFGKGCENVYDPLENRLFNTSDFEDEGIPVILPPHDRVIVVFSNKPTAPQGMETISTEKGKTLFAAIRQAEENREAEAQQKLSAAEKARVFKVNPDDCFTIDIRPFTNRGFFDSIPNDGEGGWTDQGKQHCLDEIQYGTHTWLNVPFDIIRWDQNRDTSCIVLQSQSMKGGAKSVKFIPVDKAAKRLFFLHTSAWTKTGKAFTYIVYYTDGTYAEIDISANSAHPEKAQIADWYRPKHDLNEHTKVGWKNSKGRALFIHEWVNPHPEKPINAIDIVGYNNKTIPIVIAITGESASRAGK